MNKYNYSKNNHCIDCEKEIVNDAIRCNSCKQKGERNSSFNRKGKLSPVWKGGKSKCLDCNKLLSDYDHKRYRDCYKLWFKGINHPNWQNGIGKKPYPFEFNKELKQQIRERDNYTCQNCGMTEEEHLIVIGRNLIIHHIDYRKENLDKNNLITLCFWCNVRANYNRDYWFSYFTYVMENLGVIPE